MKNYYSIAIDGPAGSGKTTIAKLIASKYGFLFVSSGIIYRIISLYLKKSDSDFQIIEKLKKLNIEYYNNEFIVNKEKILYKLSDSKISETASFFSKNINVRNFVNKLLLDISKNNNVVIDGRDIGTKVLPNADLKLFFKCSIIKRVSRRKKELKLLGIKSNWIYIFIFVLKRDFIDSKRKIDPLRKASDAIEISTTNKNIDLIISIIDKYISDRGLYE
ncbi:MAG: (d)CMP kinase [Mycoplasmoidaceae bacterium]